MKNRVQEIIAHAPVNAPRFGAKDRVLVGPNQRHGVVQGLRRGFIRNMDSTDEHADVSSFDWEGPPFARDRYGFYAVKIGGDSRRSVVQFRHESELLLAMGTTNAH